MIKDNIKIIKDFFKLVKGSKMWVFLLFLGSILGHLLSILIPIFASNIVYYVTIHNMNDTYLKLHILKIL